MTTTRGNHTATLLNNGTVLIAFGSSNSAALSASAEVYDPVTGLFTATAGSPTTSRLFQTATLLNNGKVLIAGGLGSGGALASAELYDPATGLFTATGSMTTPRQNHTATLLTNGKVLVAGDGASADLYDPATGMFTATGGMTTSRQNQPATLLNNGKVLVAGGHSGSGAVASAELYDPATGLFTATGSMIIASEGHTATLLTNGKVLVAGGGLGTSAELYDPATGMFTATAIMTAPRKSHTAALLNNGKVLIAGGEGGSGPLATAELYDPGMTLTGVGFTDSLPSGLTVVSSSSSPCGGTLTVTSPSTIVLANASIDPNSQCQFNVTVLGAAAGSYTNVTGAVTSANGGSGNTASAGIIVLAPPSITKIFGATSIASNTSTSLTFTITNPNTVALTGVGVSDTMPAGLSLAGTVTVGCSGAFAIGPDPGTVSISGVTLAGGASCTFSVTVVGTTGGVKNNVSGNVSADIAGQGNKALATLQVIAAPVITKAFLPDHFSPGGTTTVTFSIANPNTSLTLTGVAFTDSLPPGLAVASPGGVSSTCGGTATAIAGSGTISLSGGSISPRTACGVTAAVTGPEGVYVNSVQVTSTNGGTGNTSSATASSATAPNLSKAFGELSIGPLSSTTLTFTLMNPNHSVTLDALQFFDALPAGLVVSTPNGLSGNCNGGTIIAPAGAQLITVGSATLAPQTSCSFSVNVTSDGTALGYLINNTSAVTSAESLPGAVASATIFIGTPFQVSYSANLNIGESYLDIANTGANGAAVLGPGFGTQTGNICVNVYAFDPGEELVACCSCLVTPNQTVSLGVNRDLTVKTLTGAIPTSLTVKLLSSLAGGDGTGTSCTNSAATVAGAPLANGMAAWGTTLHASPNGSYDTTERAVLGATLNAGELASIGGRCASILGNGSGFGVCNSCRAGALGATKLP